MSRALECRTLGGEVYVSMRDIVAALRECADDRGADGHDDAAVVLGRMATSLDLATIQHLTDSPGDSDLGQGE